MTLRERRFSGTYPVLIIVLLALFTVGSAQGGVLGVGRASVAAGSGCTSAAVTLLPAGAASNPSTVTVSGLSGAITNVKLHINDLSHTHTQDLDFLLVAPADSANLIVMSDTGVGPTTNGGAINLTLQDGAPGLPNNAQLATGVWGPTNHNPAGDSDTFPATAPTPSGATQLAVFNGLNPNGTWALYIVDDDLVTVSMGEIAQWCLEIAVGGATPTATTSPIPSPSPTVTNTPIPPTATNTPTTPSPTATHTPVPSTPTNTPIPPTATATNTPSPPTATATATNTATATATATNTATATPVPPSRLHLPLIVKSLPCPTVEREPNDSMADADGSLNELCVGIPVTGSLAGNDPRDLFYLTHPAPGPLTIRLDGMSGNTDNDLALLNSGGIVLHYSATTGEEVITVSNLDAGRYYVMVYPYENLGGPYRLSATRP